MRVERGTASERIAAQLDGLFVRVGLRRADVDREAAGVGDDVVLRARRDDGRGDVDRAEQRRDPFEAEAAEPLDVLDGRVEGVLALVAGGVAAAAAGRAVEHHEPPFAERRIERGGFAHDRHVDAAERRQQRADAVLARDLLLGREGQQQVEGERSILQREEDRREGDERGTRIVRAEAVEALSLDRRSVGVARVARRGAYRVVVRVEQQRRPRGVVARAARRDIVVQPLGPHAVFGQKGAEQVGRRPLLARGRGGGDEASEQADGLGAGIERSAHGISGMRSSCPPRPAAGRRRGGCRRCAPLRRPP